MRWIAALAISVPLLAAQAERSALNTVTAVRHWSTGDVTRIAIVVSGDFSIRSDRLHDPERIYFDILNARPRIQARRFFAEDLTDKHASRIRVAETVPGITRIVIHLTGEVDVNTSHLTNPDRLIVELRTAAAPAPSTAPPTVTSNAAPPRTQGTVKPESRTLEPPFSLPVKPPAPVRTEAAIVTPAPGKKEAPTPVPERKAEKKLAQVDVPDLETPPPLPAKPPATTPGRTETAGAPPVPAKTLPSPGKRVEKAAAANVPDEIGRAAKRTSTGETSLVRALGLKLTRVVIDPGHGGHDQGTEGPHGLLEKDLVLDVAQRLGKLIEARLGAEVIYTRTDDTFVPLEGRTALANEKKADLFLSIHANSSPLPRVAGIETFYLNIKGSSKDALDVAARENASSQKSVFELADLIQKITNYDKAEESREFAARIQASLYGFSSRSVPGSRDRGVKTAPFVVLIGAHMPSVLAEIGFLSNTREESLLKKPDYRQKLAEALYRGISRYAESLSHFQMARAKD